MFGAQRLTASEEKARAIGLQETSKVQSAQRLTASEEKARQPRNPRFGKLTKVLNALRHQRKKHI